MKEHMVSIPPPDITLATDLGQTHAQLTLQSGEAGLFHFLLSVSFDTPTVPQALSLKWKLPHIEAKGVWKSDSIHNKRQQYDWELEHHRSRISVNSPVISVFGTQDRNVITFATREAMELIEMNALLREEDNHLYCHLTFFTEAFTPVTHYEAEIRIDMRNIPFSQALQETGKWWAADPKLTPAFVPELAKAPLYSTWYNFHQNLDEEVLLKELALAAEMGYELVILDDGWQTLDTNRGYDYAGDWKPDRIPDMAGFVENIHSLGMKAGLWFSVPFCGEKTAAYQRFKGKFLTENHRWAPVFDPRFPEVRVYLTQIYVAAVRDWGLDALKLDFIDDFQVYPETELHELGERDFSSVNQAVDELMMTVIREVKAVNPGIAIEFRQRYIGPAMRKYGNMLRAFDCPNDPVTNRIRVADVKLLCGETAVHSDPITWHPEDSVENACLQLINALFGVPQLSVEVCKLPPAHREMVTYMNSYWKAHAHILLDGDFVPYNPLGNYPLLKSERDGHVIQVAYDRILVPVNDGQTVDIFNGSDYEGLIVSFERPLGAVRFEIRDCRDQLMKAGVLHVEPGIQAFDVPIAGRLRLTLQS